MTDIEKRKLIKRNKKIIEIIMKEINKKCPYSIDMIAIGGSFCNGDIYEKSDLDLVIISRDDKASCLDKCFIIDDVAIDVYTHDWSSFEKMSDYSNPYVTKLIDLDIIYLHDKNTLKYYRGLQDKLKKNMGDNDNILRNVKNHFNNVIREFIGLQNNEDDLGLAYRSLVNIIREIEFIIYMINQSYVKRGTKRVPEEICNMEILPKDFVIIYKDITNCKNIDEIKKKTRKIVNIIKDFLLERGIKEEEFLEIKKEEIIKKDIEPCNLIGTYEEIYSNWKNKMKHAVTINSGYLSFVTMCSCQEFYDEMYNMFNIPKIDLISNYNPEDLVSNVIVFDKCMDEWLKLYEEYKVKINYYDNFDELERLYESNNKELKL